MTNEEMFLANPREWMRNEMRNWLQGRAGGSRGRRSAGRRTTGVFPPVNIYDDGEGFRVQAELPGMDASNLEINATRSELTIRGERAQEEPSEDVDWHRRERQTGSFARTVTLPDPINTDKVQASMENGVLRIFAPRSEESMPKKIDIST